MATIENRLIHLGNIPGTDVPYYHRYTIYTKDSGEQWVLRSGPSNNYSPSLSEASGDLIGSVSENAGTIKFEFEKYRNADGTTPYSVIMGNVDYPADITFNNSSYDTRLHLTTGSLVTGSDSELDLIISQMVSRGNEINSLELPYSAVHQNSNTSDKYIWGDLEIDYDNLEYTPIDGTGYKQEITLLDGTKVIIGQESENLKNQITQSGGAISGEDIFAPATDEDFEQTVNTATVAWDLVESSANWLWQHTGKPLSQIIEEAGSTVADWTSEVADSIGTTTVDLFNSAKSFFSDLFGLEGNDVTAYNTNAVVQLADSGMIATDAVYVDGNGNPVSVYDALFKVEDGNGNNFTVVRDNVYTTLNDGTTATVSSLAQMTQTATEVTEKFVNGYMSEAKALFTTGDGMASLISDVSAGLEKGLAPEQIAKIVATKLVVKTAMSQIKNEFILSESDQTLLNQGKEISDLSPEGQEALSNFAVNHPVYNTAYLAAVSFATTMLLNANEGMNSEEYTMAAIEATAQAAAQTAISVAISEGWLNISSSAGAGVGAAVAHIISASVRDMFADDHMNSHQWQSTVVTAGIMGAAAWAGSAAAIALIGGAFAGPIGAVVAAVIVSQFMGGKEYGPGEYADPSQIIQELYQITSKADGSGLEIFGVGKEGVTLKASENGIDDIYGSRQSDVLVGNNQNNIIVGSSGNDNGVDNDLIEGKGGDDILLGKEGHDHIDGGDGNDQIDGGIGNDRLLGGAGNDVIIGDQGDDTIEGNSGNDQIDSGDGDDIVDGGDGDDVIVSGAGNDQIIAGTGDDVIFSENGNDLIKAGDGSDQIDSGDGDDEIYGQDGNDNISAGIGNDIIFAGAGVDMINAGLGNDIIDAGEDNDLVLAGTGNDIVYGNTGNDSLYGEIGNDYIMGGSGDDEIDGGEGDDILVGNAGDDILSGGAGNDLYIHNLGDGKTTITDEFGVDTVRIFGVANQNNLSFVKNGNDLEITFSDNANDKIIIKDQFLDSVKVESLKIDKNIQIDLTSLSFDQNQHATYNTSTYSDDIDGAELKEKYENILEDSNNEVIYNASSSWYTDNYDVNVLTQKIDYEKYNDVQIRSYKVARNIFGGYYTVYYKYYEKNIGGGAGNDKLVGSWWNENIYGYGGNDYLYGNDGNDNIYGGDDNDLIYGGSGNDNAYGQNGTDKVYGGEDNDKVNGDYGNDTLYGEAGSDIINGNAGDDVMFGGKGNDVINTGDGHDIVFGGDGDDMIDGSQGNDYLLGEDGNDIISGGIGNDTVLGGKGNDIIDGNDGDDYLTGDDGDDMLSGGAGNDTIIGGEGEDIIQGNQGNDVIRAGSGSDMINGGDGDDQINAGSGNDLILDSKGNDQITLGDGSDLFLIETTNGGTKTVKDFNAAEDKIILKDVTANFPTLIANRNIVQDGNNVKFTYNSYTLIIENTHLSDLSDNNLMSSIVGDQFDNILQGNDFANAIFGLGGNDTINGLGGNDILWAGDLSLNMINEMKDKDILIGGKGNDILNGNAGNDTLWGEEDNDVLYGNDVDDTLFGQAGDDIMEGGKGNDTLYGGETGNDTYVFNKGDGKDIFQDISHFGYDDASQNDVIKLGSGITADDLLLKRSGTDLIISFRNNPNDSITVKYQFYYENNPSDTQYHRIEYIKFADSSLVIDLTKLTFDSNNGAAIWKGDDAANIITGVGSSDIIIGGSGDDVLSGNSGNDTLWGEGDNDTLFGNDGDDTLFGQAGDDTLEGGKGNDTLYGGETGNDTYVFNKGDGKDTFQDINHTGQDDGALNDKILLGAGLTPDDLLLKRSGTDLIINFKNNPNDSITVKYQFYYENNTNDKQYHRIEYIKFTDSNLVVDLTRLKFAADNDTSIWTGGSGNDILNGVGDNDVLVGGTGDDTITGNSGDDILWGEGNNDTLFGNDGNDTLYGQAGDDVMQGGKGNDTLYGGETGNDTYVFNKGDGKDIFQDVNHTGQDDAALNDKIILGAGFTANDLILKRSGTDLLISFKNSPDDSITVKYQFYYENNANDKQYHRIEYIKFADSAVALDLTTLSFGADGSATWKGNALDNTFNGTGGSDVMIGGAGNDTLIGNDGNDTLWGEGDNDTILGGDGNDTLYGQAGDDILHGGKGNDVLYGGETGNDTYLFNKGDGKDIFQDINHTGQDNAALNDTIKLGTGIGVDDLMLSRSGTDLIINFRNSSDDSITVKYQFYYENNANDKQYHRIEYIKFTDSSLVVDLTKLKFAADNNTSVWSGTSGNDVMTGVGDADVLIGGAGNDTLNGGSGNDTLWGEGDNDILYGNDGDDALYGQTGDDTLSGGKGNDNLFGGETGNDTYVFNKGDGNDIFQDINHMGQDDAALNDKILLGSGLSVNDLIFRRSGTDLIINFKNNSTDSITVKYQFYYENNANDKQYHRIEYIKFVDSAIAIDLTALSFGSDGSATWKGNAANNTFNGTAGADVMIGGAGDDTLIGNDGNDTLWGEGDNDTLFGNDGNDTLYGQAGDDTLSGGKGNDNLYGGETGNDTYIFNKGDGNDTFQDINHSGQDDAAMNDKIILGSGFKADDLLLKRSGTDLIINFKDNTTDSITVKYQFYYENNSTDKQYHRIEYIKFADNNDTVDLTTLKFDSNNDTSIWNGNSGNNTLIGAGDSDILIGGAGNDILVGNGGKDILRGGEGNDVFDFSSLKDSVVSAKDLIEDFEQGKDKIDLSGVEHHIAFDSLQFAYDNGNTTIKDQHSDFAIDLKGHFEMVQNDFIL